MIFYIILWFLVTLNATYTEIKEVSVSPNTIIMFFDEQFTQNVSNFIFEFYANSSGTARFKVW